MSHATATSAESLPLYVTWDEWAIVSAMVTALQSAVSGDAAYTGKQTALLRYMNGGLTGAGQMRRGSGGAVCHHHRRGLGERIGEGPA